MKVGIIGIYDPSYARNYVIREGLERVGVEVVVATPLNRKKHLRGRIFEMVKHFSQVKNCDVILIPAFNQVIAPLIWLMCLLHGKPVLLDYMIGLTDVEEDRQWLKSYKTRIFRWIDRFNLSTLTCITDTAAHCRAFTRLLGGQYSKLRVLPVGARDMLPLLPAPRNKDHIVVQFVGTFIPFHGVDIILEAANLLRDEEHILFEFIGQGQTYKESKALAKKLELSNVRFIKGYFDAPELLDLMAYSTILLGVFGVAEKTNYVVPNKIYEGLLLGRPLITAEAPALQEFFTPGEHFLTVPPGDAQALANAIRQLAASEEERERLRMAGLARIHEQFLPQHIGRKLKNLLDELVGNQGLKKEVLSETL